MDPFTQRMLERAKARREKLDTQLSNAGHDVRKRRSPLKDANAILAQAPAIKSPSTIKPTVKTTSSIKQSSDKSPSKNIIHEAKVIDKENGENPVTSVRSKLQRLGKLYSEDSSRELSSPIHRTEEKFTSEDEPNEHKSCKSGARLDRLAALASTINNWEDDLSHPMLPKCTKGNTVKAKTTFNKRVESIEDPQPSTSGQSKWRSNDASYSQVNRKSSNGNQNDHREGKADVKSTKQLKWDKDVLKTLEAQGFSRTVSNTRLIYDYKSCSQESCSDLPKAKEQLDNEQLSKRASPSAGTASTSKYERSRTNVKAKEESKTVVSKPTNSFHISDGNQNSKTPEKTAKNVNSGGCNARITSKFVCTGSPRSPVQSPGSVLSKASMFESKNMEPKPKDPAEMTLSERMALFERNKGEAPLVPKAPLTMSVPTKKLLEKEKPSLHNGENSTTPTRSNGDVNNKVINRRAIFEDGRHVQELENEILRSSQTERQRELDMLRSRFNRNKEVAQAAAGSCIRTSESSEGGKPNSPKNSPVCPVKPTPAPDFVPPPPPLPQTQSSMARSVPTQIKSSPVKRQVVNSPPKFNKQNKLHFDVKRIRVSPPKPGHLYPDLSNIEITETESTESTESEYTVGETEPETATLDERTETETEAEYYVGDEETEDDYTEESEDMANTSLGRSILRVVSQKTISNKKRSIDPDPDSTTSDISVLDEMDEYLDECLAVQDAHGDDGTRLEGPTPPKLNKGGKSSSTISASFNPSYRSPIKVISPASSPRRREPYIVEGDNCVPLMHSVSFYRRQQSQTPKTPVRLVSRVSDDEIVTTSSSSQFSGKDEAALVQDKVKHLLEDVCKQQTVIGQASQALNLCNATVEFSGSREQVEGERLLLVATHRRQAALNEVQRLKVEGTLRPAVPGSPEFDERGSLTISAITLPLKRDYFRNVDSDTCLHFVCLVRHMEFVVATPVVLAEIGDSCIRFPSTLKLQDLCSDFKITIEIYSLETRAEILPHEIKYHIHGSGSTVVNSGGGGSAKKGSGKTPKKFLKQDSRLIMPTVQSPAGPSAVRSPAFSLSGYVIFSLKEVQRQQFTLNKVPQSSPLEGRLQMHVTCELSVSVEHHGFLTMFEDISGFGAWHRRWCLLKGATLSYWKYPDDERKKTPIASLDLQSLSTTSVGLVSRDICARSNTFLLETIRPAQPGDSDSLVMIRKGPQTTIRHLLSADTKEDRLEWCSKLNKTLNLIRTWGGASASL